MVFSGGEQWLAATGGALCCRGACGQGEKLQVKQENAGWRGSCNMHIFWLLQRNVLLSVFLIVPGGGEVHSSAPSEFSLLQAQATPGGFAFVLRDGRKVKKVIFGHFCAFVTLVIFGT